MSFGEELVALGGRQFARRHVVRLGTDLDVRPRVGPQIVHPGRVLRRAGERSDDDQLAVDAEVGQRRHPGLAGFRPGRGEQQQVGIVELAADLAAVGAELVGDGSC